MKMSVQSGTELSKLWLCLSTEFYLKNAPAISGHVYEVYDYYDGEISYFGLLGHNAT